MVTFDSMLKQCEARCEAMENPNPFLVFTGKGIEKVLAFHKIGGRLTIEEVVDIQLAEDQMFILGLNPLEDSKDIHILKYEDFKNITIIREDL